MESKNNINGLVYGNGGLVGWDKETCLNMQTHENAETDENQNGLLLGSTT